VIGVKVTGSRTVPNSTPVKWLCVTRRQTGGRKGKIIEDKYSQWYCFSVFCRSKPGQLIVIVSVIVKVLVPNKSILSEPAV
jgi:hypothetical protein